MLFNCWAFSHYNYNISIVQCACEGEDLRADGGEDRVTERLVWGDKTSCTAFLRAQTA